MKVLMVCLGNICRSPLAQGVLETKCKKLNLNWQIDSAGTGSWHIGNPPDHRSIKVAKENGIDISRQKARQISNQDFYDFDLILTMDDSNYKNVLKLKPADVDLSKIRSIMSFSQSKQQEVPDPYYDGKFEEAYNLLNGVMDMIITTYTK